MISPRQNPDRVDSKCVFFDFDGTLSRGDSGWHFLLFCFKWQDIPHIFRAFLRILKDLFLGRKDRNKFKAYIFGSILKGKSLQEIQRLGRTFSQKHLCGNRLFPEMMRRLKVHQTAGNRCILVSASLGEYLQFWALEHGFEAVLATRLEIGFDQRATGQFQGKNCYGEEKRQRILAYLKKTEMPEKTEAYGNSAGDFEMMEAVLEAGGKSWFVWPGGEIEPWKGRKLEKR